MGETLNLLFRRREDDSYELQARESWSGRTVSSIFFPPYEGKKLDALEKKLDKLESNGRPLRDGELIKIGQELFNALSGTNVPELTGSRRRDSSEMSVQAMLRTVIQRTVQRRGTVALIISFAPGCEAFVRYPWELLHNGEHFLIASGIFTLTRVIFDPGNPVPGELPVHAPFRILYMSASPEGFPALDTARSYKAMQQALFDLREEGSISLDCIEQVTFNKLVTYLHNRGGTGLLNDSEITLPCYVVHFDGHGAYGRLCPDEDCRALNRPHARRCEDCGVLLTRVKPQTYLCFSDEEYTYRYIDTESLRELFLTSDVRLAVFSACETAMFSGETGAESGTKQRHKVTYDTTLATALLRAQVPAIVAMPYSLQDELSSTFMFHFYESLAQGHTLEEALGRARQAMLLRHESWFIPVLYRHSSQQQVVPVPLLAGQTPEEHDQPLAHLRSAATFIGRERELRDLQDLLEAAARQEAVAQQDEHGNGVNGNHKLPSGIHHIALIGPAGIGKSALAMEAAQRSTEKFPGGVIGVSLQAGKTFADALAEIAHALHILPKAIQVPNPQARTRMVLSTFQQYTDRSLPFLLLLDGFEEVKELEQIRAWHRFLCSLPRHVVVLLTSQTNPATTAVLEGATCRWHEYHLGKMRSDDLLKLFEELAETNGLHDRLHLEDCKQQEILQNICTELDGYPLGAELIFGMTRMIGGKVFTPEAATRSLEEIYAELRETPLPGIWAALEVAYLRLTLPARLLLSYLSAFKLPFSTAQIVMLIDPKTPATQRAAVRLEREHLLDDERASGEQELVRSAGTVMPGDLAKNWREARDELVRSSFIQLEGLVYTIHPQVRLFAISYLLDDERRRVHRLMAEYYTSLPQPSPDEWFAAFEHLQSAGEAQDLQAAVHVAMRASWALAGRGREAKLLTMLRQAQDYALQLDDKTGEGQILCCLGAVLRQLGDYADAENSLLRSLGLHREQQERDEAGWALYELALLKREQGHYRQAGEYAAEAGELFREAGDSNGEAWMQVTLGEVARGYGNYPQAMEFINKALANFEKHPVDQEGYAWAMHTRAMVFAVLGDARRALADDEEALRLFNTLGLRPRQAWVLADMAFIYTNQGKYEQAEEQCRKAFAIFHEQHIRRGEGWASHILGDIARQQQEYSDARGYYENAQAIFAELRDRISRARVLVSLGAICNEEGEYPVAQEHYSDALAIARDESARPIEGRALRGLGDVSSALRHFSNARQYYEQALDIANQLQTPGEQAATLHRLGRIARIQGQYSDALTYLVHALSLDHRLGHATREKLVEEIDVLINEHNLGEEYAILHEKYRPELAFPTPAHHGNQATADA